GAVRYGLFAGAAPSGGLVIPPPEAPVVGVVAALASNPRLWLVMFGILLHGICYDFFFVTGQIYVDKKATAAIRGQAQGFLVLVTQGLGMLIGAQAAGWFEQANHTRVGGSDAVTWQPVWFTAAATATIVLV